jgi:hypothetical protein
MTDPRGEALQPFSRQQLDATLADLKEMWAALVAVAMSVPGAKEVLVPRKDLPETIEMIFAQAATNAVPHEDLMLTIWKDGSYLCQSVEGDREVQMTTDWFVSIPLVAGYHALQSATPEVESTKVSELKRQLAAEREHGRLLQAQVDAFARPAPERSGVGVVEALDIMNGLQPATQRSEPVAWRYLRKGTDSETLIFQSPDKVTRPQDYDITPLYAAPFSETPAGGTAKVPEGWKLVPLKLYEDTRLVMIQCEAGDWSFEEGWGRLLSSCPPPPGHAAAPSPDGNEEKGK